MPFAQMGQRLKSLLRGDVGVDKRHATLPERERLQTKPALASLGLTTVFPNEGQLFPAQHRIDPGWRIRRHGGEDTLFSSPVIAVTGAYSKQSITAPCCD